MKALWTQLPSYKKKFAKAKKVNKQAKPREPRKRINSVSSNQAVLKRQYNKLLDLLYGNPRKAKCGVDGCKDMMTENHHTRGRRGKLLLDARWFMPVCAHHHKVAHEYPLVARQLLGLNPKLQTIPLLCPKGKWGQSE